MCSKQWRFAVSNIFKVSCNNSGYFSATLSLKEAGVQSFQVSDRSFSFDNASFGISRTKQGAPIVVNLAAYFSGLANLELELGFQVVVEVPKLFLVNILLY